MAVALAFWQWIAWRSLGESRRSDARNRRQNSTRPCRPTWSKANPVDISGDADAKRYLAALDVLLDDPASDAVLIMNVETAVASAPEIAGAVADFVKRNRASQLSLAKPVLATWVGTDQTVAPIFEGAAIPHFETEDDAVRAFMHLVKHREATLALMATPPELSSLFRPDVKAARKIVEGALKEGRAWLDPIEIAALFEAYSIPMVPTLAAASPDEARSEGGSFSRERTCRGNQDPVA